MNPTAPLPPRSHDLQHRWLEALVARYHHQQFIAPDPLQIVRKYPDPADREIIGLIAACLSYGNVKAILLGIAQIEDRIGPQPARWLLRSTPATIAKCLAGFRYRITPDRAITGLLIGSKAVIQAHRNLGAALEADLHATADDLPLALDRWVARIEEHADTSLDHLLPRPSRRSACKRLFLYLRWMVRCDEIDPGGWSIDPAILIAPIDTHIHKVAKQLGWTTRKQANLATALQVTEAMRSHAPHDPLRYDFALTRPGIRRESIG